MFSIEIFPSTVRKKFLYTVLKRNKSFWGNVPMAEPDSYFGVGEAFVACRNPQKINLGIGSYRDEHGMPYVLQSVRKAEKIILTMFLFKEYDPTLGSKKFRELVAKLILGKNSPNIKNNTYVTAQSVSRTGAMRISSAFIKKCYPFNKTIYLPEPTWRNHERILSHSNLEHKTYRYYDLKKYCLDFKNMLDDLNKIPDHSIVVLHACSHNPTGTDPTEKEWDELSALCLKKKHLAYFDNDNQGCATGDLEKDVYSIRKFVADNNNVAIVQSFSKNMGLYGERTGSVTFLTHTLDEATRIKSQLKIIIRGLYSNPPIHGARIVVKILEDTGLKAIWKKEIQKMAERLTTTRAKLVDKLKKEGSTKNWDYLEKQTGSFGYMGLTTDQLQKLTKDHSIFIPDCGRISVGSINKTNLDYIAHAIHLVTRQ